MAKLSVILTADVAIAQAIEKKFAFLPKLSTELATIAGKLPAGPDIPAVVVTVLEPPPPNKSGQPLASFFNSAPIQWPGTGGPAPITLSSIAVRPASPPNLKVTSTQQFIATGTFSDGSTADITSQVTWQSSDTSAASISSSGLATGEAVGSTSITASLSGVTSPSVNLTVIAYSAPGTLSSIAVTQGSPPSLRVSLTQQFVATGKYSDGTTEDITSQVTWASSASSIATISAAGLATGVAVGTTNITASLSGITSPSVTLTVIAGTPSRTLVAIALFPQSPPTLAVGFTQGFLANGTYSDGTTAIITSQVTWSSSNPSVATITPGGLATGIVAGTTQIIATLGSISSPAVTLTVGITTTPIPGTVVLPVDTFFTINTVNGQTLQEATREGQTVIEPVSPVVSSSNVGLTLGVTIDPNIPQDLVPPSISHEHRALFCLLLWIPHEDTMAAYAETFAVSGLTPGSNMNLALQDVFEQPSAGPVPPGLYDAQLQVNLYIIFDDGTIIDGGQEAVVKIANAIQRT